MSRDTFTVRLGNVYVANRQLARTIRKLLEGRPDAIVVNEGRHAARRPVRALMARLGYRLHVAQAGEPRGRTDVLIYVHKRNRYLGALTVVLSRAMPAFPASHERQLVAALLDTAVGKVAVVGIHPSPGPKALNHGPADHPIVRQYAEAMRRTDLILGHLVEDLGYRVVLAGDVQLRRDAGRRPWSPYVMLTDAGLDVTVAEGLDLIAHGPGLAPVEGRVLARKGTAGEHDHDLLTATYRKAPR